MIRIEPVATPQDCYTSIEGDDTPRLFELANGDIFTLNNFTAKYVFGMPIRKIKLNDIMDEHFICMGKTKRKHWWQFWKPKYTFAKFMYVEKENTKCRD